MIIKIITFLLFFSTYFYAAKLFMPLPKNIEYNEDIVNLGRELFYDPILSKNKDISCFSCHNNYGAENKQYSTGSDGKIGNMNSPSIFNLKYKIAYFWNGRATNLETQLLSPLLAKHEMNNNKDLLIKRLKGSAKYRQLFRKAYNTSPNFQMMIEAMYEFEETLLSIDSKFDKYLREEISLSSEEKKGLDLFISYGCVSCHNGINIGGNSYQKFGSVIEKPSSNEQWNDRYNVTKKQRDKMVFIVPSLRNVEKTAPYFHDGSSLNLKDAIILMGYYNIGIKLQDSEISAIEAFLKTLTGEIPKTFIRQ